MQLLWHLCWQQSRRKPAAGNLREKTHFICSIPAVTSPRCSNAPWSHYTVSPKSLISSARDHNYCIVQYLCACECACACMRVFVCVYNLKNVFLKVFSHDRWDSPPYRILFFFSVMCSLFLLSLSLPLCLFVSLMMCLRPELCSQ